MPAGVGAILLLLPLLTPGLAAPAIAAEPVQVALAYITVAEQPPIPLSLAEPVVTDAGLQGARLGLADNQTTGGFMGQQFSLQELVVPEGGDVAATFTAALEAGYRLFIVDLEAADLLALADAPGADQALLLNTRARDDALRNEQCRPNVLHLAPSRAMLADALAQYLMTKQWDEWFLVVGQHDGDRAFADALRRAAGRYAAEIVVEKEWTFVASNRRVDTGHVTAQSEVLNFTQVDDHDVLVVADEADEFGEYLAYRTWLPRPVAGTQGLVPASWSRVHEQWGGTQLQTRFEEQTGRWMTERDYAAWMAARVIGEAATRTGSGDPATIADYVRGPDFELGAFKGVGLTFRAWDGQLRQPILLVSPRMLVSVSPQPGYLHEFSELDTLGDDEPDSRCQVTQ